MKRIFLSLAFLVTVVFAAQAQTCNRCGDSGVIHETCLPCNGKGTWRCDECRGNGEVECYHCQGSGELKCYACDGTGMRGEQTCYN